MAFMNTLLTRGRAELLVTATGSESETGRLSRELAATVEVPTPLQVQLDTTVMSAQQHVEAVDGVAVFARVATHWGPASRLFGTTGMAWADWGIAAGAASSVLVLEEARKIGFRAFLQFRKRASK
jgi:hypothetical protein